MRGPYAPLKRYLEIRDRKRVPFFMLIKKIACERSSNLDDMWAEHKRGLKIFRRLKRNEPKAMAETSDESYSLLDLKYDIAMELLKSCVFCERRCMANRAEGRLGWCRVGSQSRVATMFEHYGEEDVLVPSGTIFFSGCTWKCVYCQNWDISQFPERGVAMTGKEIACWIDDKAESGRIINANFVGGEPTPNLHTIIDTARNMKSQTPIIWNSNMYMSEESLALLEGVVDLYLADFRYGNDNCAMRLSSAPRYMATMRRNFRRASKDAEMVIRILVLPNHIECCAKNILKWIGDNIADRVYVNLMSQYRPEYKAVEYPEIARRLYNEEYERAIQYLKNAGVKYYEIQGRI
ncbi:MAG: radical SAM protein [Candidatus Bilamarchaeaceae archaeon]